MPLRVGIIGTGWGVRAQIPGFRQAGLEVTALCSRSPSRAKELAATHGVAHFFTSAAELVACEDVDLVCVVTPAHERKEAVLLAVRAGKHVLAEKPLGLTHGDALEMVRAAAEAPPEALHLVDFELRCVPGLRAAKAFVDNGDIGRVQFATFSLLGNVPFLADDAVFGHWNRRECGGGVFSVYGQHYLDCVRYLLSTEVARVSAVALPLVGALPDQDGKPHAVTSDGYVTAQFLMSDATPVHFTLSGRTPGPNFMENRVVIVGASGSIRFDFQTCELRAWLGGADPSGAPTVSLGPGAGDAWAKVGTPELGRALRLALTGEKDDAEPAPLDLGSLATFEDGAIVRKVSDAVHTSADQDGAWVEVIY